MTDVTHKTETADTHDITYSVIIPAYNEELLLPKTLSNLKEVMENISLRGEIIVVDNNSSDRTGSVAQEYGTRVFFELYRQIAKARNCGAREAKGTYLIFLDADTVLPEQLLKKALDLLGTSHYCGGGTLLRFDSQLPYLAQKLVELWNWISKTGQLAAGSFIFCLQEAFNATGGFDETVYAGEEIFFSRNLKNWGKANNKKFIIIEDQAVITSGRKFHWYSSLQLLILLLVFTVFPVAFRYRTLCRFWYGRPNH